MTDYFNTLIQRLLLHKYIQIMTLTILFQLSKVGSFNYYHNLTSNIILVSDDELDDNTKSPWYIFNDFLVRNVSPVEALSFSEWKVSTLIILIS